MLNKDCLNLVMEFVPSDLLCSFELDWAWLPPIEPDRSEDLTTMNFWVDDINEPFQLHMNLMRWDMLEQEDEYTINLTMYQVNDISNAHWEHEGCVFFTGMKFRDGDASDYNAQDTHTFEEFKEMDGLQRACLLREHLLKMIDWPTAPAPWDSIFVHLRRLLS